MRSHCALKLPLRSLAEAAQVCEWNDFEWWTGEAVVGSEANRFSHDYKPEAAWKYTDAEEVGCWLSGGSAKGFL